MHKKALDDEKLSTLGNLIKWLVNDRFYEVNVDIGVSVLQKEGLTFLLLEILPGWWLTLNAINTYIS
ncbi:hypothetical protein Q7C_2605 [Methylophaga frappieri]|uniref:Uncharacterized protein n=1 Tax=Methylophaga frappieri (strain ATCC BAA-2434 / DSM 25690 / JAM7) TaxID=754477 RepID=I1YLD3_METFJ|nr:hypothetical protein Q7C_2605 [Methylophaga frappieri]